MPYPTFPRNSEYSMKYLHNLMGTLFLLTEKFPPSICPLFTSYFLSLRLALLAVLFSCASSVPSY